MKDIKVIAFDADDTLWVNEPYFRQSEEIFCDLLSEYLPKRDIQKLLFKTEIENLDTFGYGTKAFILSMIETAIQITDNNISGSTIEKIIRIGRNQLNKKIELLPDIEKVLGELKDSYRLVMATKGDLKEQEGKLFRSGLEAYFHHTEIVSEKTPKEYGKLIRHLDINPSQFLMVGNSLKSDILPVLEAGGNAIHIPFHTTWEHEVVDVEIDNPRFGKVEKAMDLLDILTDKKNSNSE